MLVTQGGRQNLSTETGGARGTQRDWDRDREACVTCMFVNCAHRPARITISEGNINCSCDGFTKLSNTPLRPEHLAFLLCGLQARIRDVNKPIPREISPDAKYNVSPKLEKVLRDKPLQHVASDEVSCCCCRCLCWGVGCVWGGGCVWG